MIRRKAVRKFFRKKPKPSEGQSTEIRRRDIKEYNGDNDEEESEEIEEDWGTETVDLTVNDFFKRVIVKCCGSKKLGSLPDPVNKLNRDVDNVGHQLVSV